MAYDLIMVFGGFVFALLFMFLMFVGVTSTISLFRKREYPEYEPKVSIIVPCYNEEKNIKSCLDSINSLDYPRNKIELIVVDDGSTDNTLSIVNEYGKKHKKIRILKGKHEGKAPSLTLAAKQASHEIICAVDADTLMDRQCLRKLARPFADKKMGLTNGSWIARNDNSIISTFQKIEYYYHNLLRRSFSNLFNNGIWFFGACICYRKEALRKIGYFKTDTMTEDMDTAMEIYAAGYKTINIHDALSYTIVPSKVTDFIKQRTRWFIGGFQSLWKNRKLFSRKSSASVIFLFINQYWWTFFAIIFFPLIAYQVWYWLPHGQGSYAVFAYLFRWFTLAGPVYVLYKIPEWGVSLYSIFGVLSGIITALLITKAVYMFRDRLRIRNTLGLFFFFPYTMLLNVIIIISLLKLIFLKKRHFIY